MNVLLELDEDDPDRFYLSGGLKSVFEALKSTFLSLILIVILFFYLDRCYFLGAFNKKKSTLFFFHLPELDL